MSDKQMINQVFHNQLLCRNILGHISDVHNRLNKSTIKGGVLHSSGDLMMMLKFNATSMFIESFDSVDNYPYNTSLLKCAAQYNNTRAFNHLIKHPNIIIDQTVFKLEHVCQHGNIDILRSYIDATQCHSTSIMDFVECLPLIDRGNEHFVRLLLQHIKSRGIIPTSDDIKRHAIDMEYGANESLLEGIAQLDEYTLQRQGISVGVLRVLHEDSRYILDNLTMDMANNSHYSLAHFLSACARDGNIELISIVGEYEVGIMLLKRSSLYGLINVAVENGREAFIRHLYKHHTWMRFEILRLLDTQSQPTCDDVSMSSDMPKLPPTPMAAIYTDDLINAEHLITQFIIIDQKYWRTMSESMARLISSPRSPPLEFHDGTLLNMVTVMSQPGSNITSDIVCMFIDNCEIDVGRYINFVMEVAAGCSAAVMTRIHTKYDQPYETSECLAKALTSRCRETLELMQDCFDMEIEGVSADDIVHDPFKVHHKFISKASIDEIRLMFKHSVKVKSDPKICEWAARNHSSEVFDYIISLFRLGQLVGILPEIVHYALVKDNPQHIHSLQRHFGDVAIDEITSSTVEHMANKNAHHSLSYYLNTTSFNKQSTTHRLRTINNILNTAYQIGATRLIKLCINHIDSLNQLMNNDHLAPHTQQQSMNVSTCPGLDQAFHLVFCDGKLATMIMRQIGLIHSSLGIDLDRVIKGSTLLDNNLLQFIKFGATEYFIKSYSTINNQYQYPHNTTLLSEAFAKCDSLALEVLLANPNMMMTYDHYGHLDDDTLWNISSCSHPHWEWILDQYFKMFTSATPVFINEILFLLARHPSFHRKLIQMGVKLESINEDNDYYFVLRKGWLTKPWALEMVQFLRQQSLMPHRQCLQNILEIALSDGLPSSVFGYIVRECEEDVVQLDTWSLIESCCEYGRPEHLDIMLTMPGIDLSESRLVELFDTGSRSGCLAVVKRIHQLIKGSGHRQHVINSIQYALEDGHVDLVNYLIDQCVMMMMMTSYQTIQMVGIRRIHQSIVSIELIERLMAHPNIFDLTHYDYHHGLIDAFELCDQALIEYIEMKNPPLKQHSSDLFRASMKVGNVQMAKKLLMDKDRGLTCSASDVASLIDCIGLPGKGIDVTEDKVAEFVALMPRSDCANDAIVAASSKSLSLIKLVITPFIYEISAADLVASCNFNRWIDNCAKRCDVQAIDYLINLAIRVRHRVTSKHGYGWDQQRIQDMITLNVFNDSNASVLSYLMDKGYLSVENVKSSALAIIVNNACVDGNVETLRMIHQRCVTASQLQRHLPSMSSIQEAVINNHHRLITYMFEGVSDGSSPYVRAKVDQMNITKLLNTVRHHAFVNGCLNIINMCDRLISAHIPSI
ncbi:hypothetical protein SAMD00019534_041350 [Acytostelium subglobosum LB1]|uniref:hypothetical protein n=1 Tax=Acytostelium subglobosum LB1 TaxID=1410327 RepID=UPI000644C631|nr:hypothetical protein SAMD00019534_041350 [Acytostelium subglobosum LB1]GAM20960.1 hypothetical protein SAMD00019534_041350 [Acytostelium subglobosum LB1]|eukprot:XP_012756094.1 hypothetical protein SAMD00019534_041350 [Acytostelium subglobosum LB1]